MNLFNPKVNTISTFLLVKFYKVVSGPYSRGVRGRSPYEALETESWKNSHCTCRKAVCKVRGLAAVHRSYAEWGGDCYAKL